MTPDEILKDPSFQKLSPEDQKKILAALDTPSMQPAGGLDSESEEPKGPRTARDVVREEGWGALPGAAGRSAMDFLKGAYQGLGGLAARAAGYMVEGERSALPTERAKIERGEAPPIDMNAAALRAQIESGTAALPGEKDEFGSKGVGRFVGRAAPAVAAMMAVPPSVVPQAIGGAGVMGAQTLLETGDPSEAAKSAAIGAAIPVGFRALGVAISKLPANLREGAAMQLAKLLGLDPAEALKFIEPGVGAREGIVERAADTLGVGTGRTLVRRASEAARTAGQDLERVKAGISGQRLPVDVLDETEAAVRGSASRLQTPTPQAPPPPSPILGPTGQPIGTAPAAPMPPKPVESLNMSRLKAADALADDIQAISDNYKAVAAGQPPVAAGTTPGGIAIPGAAQAEVPVSELLTARTQLGQAASPAFTTLPTEEVAAKAAAARPGYGRLTQSLHDAFPELKTVDLTFHESKLVADALYSQIMKTAVERSAGPSAVALKAAAGAPFLATADTGIGAATLGELPKSFGALYVAMKIVTSPLWRSAGIQARLTIARGIEAGGLSASTQLAQAGGALATGARAASTTPPGEVPSEEEEE